jgi:hypothetical protein
LIFFAILIFPNTTMKKYKYIILAVYVVCCLLSSPLVYSQTQRQIQPLRTTLPSQDSISTLSVRFLSGVTRSGESLLVIEPSLRVTLQQFGITDDRIRAQFPSSPNGQELLQNELGEWYATPDVSKVALLTLPQGTRPELVINALSMLSNVGSVGIYKEPQIERD